MTLQTRLLCTLIHIFLLCTACTGLHAQQWFTNWKTIDSGWYIYNGERQTSYVDGIECPDSMNCITYGSGPSAFLRYTTDGGDRWQTTYGDTFLIAGNNTRYVHEIAYTSLNLCLAVGQKNGTDGALILRSTDRGVTWQRISHNLDSRRGLVGISMYDDHHGVVMNGFDSLIITTDGGLTWSRIPPPEPDRHPFFNGVYCLGPGIYLTWGIRDSANNHQQRMLRGYERAIYRTDDYGRHWSGFFFLDSIHPDETQVVNNPEFYYAAVPSRMKFLDSLHGIAIGCRIILANGYSGKSVIMITDDGGRTWRTVLHEQRCSHSLLFSGISFYDKLNGMVTGNQLMFMRTTDGGETWLEECIDPNIYLFPSGVAYKSKTWAMASATTGQIVKWLGSPTLDVPQEQDRRARETAGTVATARVTDNGLTVHYKVPRAVRVQVSVLDLLGRQALVLPERGREAGEYTEHIETGRLPSGAYLLRVTAGQVSILLPVSLVR